MVDLKHDDDQQIDLVTGEVGLHASSGGRRRTRSSSARLTAPAACPNSKTNVKGYVRGFDVRPASACGSSTPSPSRASSATTPGKKIPPITPATPASGDRSASMRSSAWPILPVELPTGDYYGGHRPGNGLFGESIVAVDLKTGQRKWHYQLVHHGIWDMDIPCAPMLVDITVNGRTVKAVAQPTKQAFLYVFDRATGKPIWPIDERPVAEGQTCRARGIRPRSRFRPSLRLIDRNGISIDDLIDFTPELRAEAVKMASRYKIGPHVHAAVAEQGGRSAGHAGGWMLPGRHRTGRADLTIRKRICSTPSPGPTSLHSGWCLLPPGSPI